MCLLTSSYWWDWIFFWYSNFSCYFKISKNYEIFYPEFDHLFLVFLGLDNVVLAEFSCILEVVGKFDHVLQTREAINPLFYVLEVVGELLMLFHDLLINFLLLFEPQFLPQQHILNPLLNIVKKLVGLDSPDLEFNFQ